MSSMQVITNRDRIFKKLHFNDGTEAFKNAYSIFDELSSLLKNNMKLTSVHKVVDSRELNIEELYGFEKYVICLVFSEDEISEISNEMMSAGEYLKGYLLHEIATDVIFTASDALNKEVGIEASQIGYGICGTYAPGDGKIDLKMQGALLAELEKEAKLNVYLNDEYILIPEKSLLYVLGLKLMQNTGSAAEEYSACGKCCNLYCEYRKK